MSANHDYQTFFCRHFLQYLLSLTLSSSYASYSASTAFCFLLTLFYAYPTAMAVGQPLAESFEHNVGVNPKKA